MIIQDLTPIFAVRHEHGGPINAVCRNGDDRTPLVADIHSRCAYLTRFHFNSFVPPAAPA